VALNPTKWFMPYVTYAEALRAPTVNETLMGGDHPGAGPRQSFFPNPFLEPEIQKGWEVGFNTAVEHVFTHRHRDERVAFSCILHLNLPRWPRALALEHRFSHAPRQRIRFVHRKSPRIDRAKLVSYPNHTREEGA